MLIVLMVDVGVVQQLSFVRGGWGGGLKLLFFYGTYDTVAFIV
jgi:hypothetical protein